MQSTARMQLTNSMQLLVRVSKTQDRARAVIAYRAARNI